MHSSEGYKHGQICVSLPLSICGGRQRQISGCFGICDYLPVNLVLVKASLSVQFSPSCTHPGPAEPATNCSLLCNSKKVSQGQEQAAFDIGLHQSTSQGDPEPTYLVASFRQHQSKIQIVSQATYPTCTLWSVLMLIGCQPES